MLKSSTVLATLVARTCFVGALTCCVAMGIAFSGCTVRTDDGPWNDHGADAGREGARGSERTESDGPAADAGPSGARDAYVALSAGTDFTCALGDAGRVKCWGKNKAAQLGLGDLRDRGAKPGDMGDALPSVDLGTGRRARSIVAGESQACAILDDGQVACWGETAYWLVGAAGLPPWFRGDAPGEMGDALPTIHFGDGRRAKSVVPGRDGGGCAYLDDGTGHCWDNTHRPRLVTGFGASRKVNTIASSQSHACAILDDGAVTCWGDNSLGQLGLGDRENRGYTDVSPPTVNLGTGRTATAIAARYGQHTCAILDNGALKCWGLNFSGELGLGDRSYRGDDPGEMGDALPAINLGVGRTAKAVGTGEGFTCALLDGESVKCWGGSWLHGPGGNPNIGDEPGEMGDALPTIRLGTGRRAKSLSVGASHACVILDDRNVKCWGSNGYGQLGIEERGDRIKLEGMGDALPSVRLGGLLGAL